MYIIYWNNQVFVSMEMSQHKKKLKLEIFLIKFKITKIGGIPDICINTNDVDPHSV